MKTTILYWNCSKGLLAKLDFLKETLIKYSPLLFFITECEIKNSDQINACQIKDYELLISGGLNVGKSRVCCYAKDGQGFERLVNLEGPDHLELIVLESKLLKLRTAGFYNPFKIPEHMTRGEYIDALLEIMSNASKTHLECLIGGDMNIDLMKTTPLSNKLNEWILDHGFTQHVKDITRYRTVRLSDGKIRTVTSMIDHVYSSLPNDEVELKLQPTDYSDHDLVIIVVDRPLHSESKIIKIRIRDWKKYDDKALNQTVDHYGLNEVNYREVIQTITEQLAPYRSIRIRAEKVDQIINAKLEKKKKKRDRLFKAFKQTRIPAYYDKAKILSKQIAKYAKKKVKETLQEKVNLSTRSFWNTVNQLLGKNRKHETVL